LREETDRAARDLVERLPSVVAAAQAELEKMTGSRVESFRQLVEGANKAEAAMKNKAPSIIELDRLLPYQDKSDREAVDKSAVEYATANSPSTEEPATDAATPDEQGASIKDMKFRTAVDALGFTAEEIERASNTRIVALPFQKMMASYNTFLLTQSRAQDLKVMKLGHEADDAADVAKNAVLAYLASPVTYPEQIDRKLHAVKNIIDEQEQKVRTRLNSQVGKDKKRKRAELEAKTDEAGPSTGQKQPNVAKEIEEGNMMRTNTNFLRMRMRMRMRMRLRSAIDVNTKLLISVQKEMGKQREMLQKLLDE